MNWSREHLSNIRIPVAGDKIYKDECVFSFDTPETETGLFVCMNTFLGFGKKHVERHFRKTGNAVYLHLKRIKKEVPQETKDNVEKKITRMAIGVEGGFELEGKKYEYEDFNSIVVLPDFTSIPLPNCELPEVIQLSAATIIAAESAARLEEAQALAGTWDGEKPSVSKYAENLVQLDNGVKIPPKGWRCAECDKTDNLWMNLTDGTILCGRRFFDGSGGNNHASEHYLITNYPLAVKLGTITPDGADVFSYAEDNMVEDPYLTKHLAHFGINITQMEKTDKSMVELEIDMNQRIGEWATIQEAGSQLVPLYGPGYTGLANLGNSCYLNSVMQVVFSIPDFKTMYADADNAERIFNNATMDLTGDLTIQLAKLGQGIWSGDYSQPPAIDPAKEKQINEEQPGIKLRMFKSLIGKGHPEFSTKRQQDAQEFFLHLINMLERQNRGTANPADCFKYQEEDRIICLESGMVKYVNSTQYILRLPIPMEAALNHDEFSAYNAKKKEAEASGVKFEPEVVTRARIPLQKCLDFVAKNKLVSDFYSTAVKCKTMASKSVRMATFPDYLMIQLEKFTFDVGWIPTKLDVSIDVPDELDLGFFRGKGMQPHEEELPEETIEAADPVPLIDPVILKQLMEMGFGIEGCKRAIFHTNNESLSAAAFWAMEHVGDPDFRDPFIPPEEGALAKGALVPNEIAIESIMGMGFTREQACKALTATDNNVERAVDWIFSHADEIDETMDTSEPKLPQAQYRDGPGKYRLVAFISHMGTSTMVGHYVCHIKKDGRWVIFNDNKVAISENPPKDLAYLYLYERINN